MATAAKAGSGTNGLVDSPIQHESGRSAALALITWGALVGLLTGVPFQLGAARVEGRRVSGFVDDPGG